METSDSVVGAKQQKNHHMGIGESLLNQKTTRYERSYIGRAWNRVAVGLACVVCVVRNGFRELKRSSS